MLEALKAGTTAAKPDDAAIASDDSDSTADGESIVRHSERERLLTRRSHRRLKSHLAEAMEGSGGSSFLEAVSVTSAVRNRYRAELNAFLAFCDRPPVLKLTTDDSTDLALV
eukprot:1751921-Heterocapsa_arctica.AAC.1